MVVLLEAVRELGAAPAGYKLAAAVPLPGVYSTLTDALLGLSMITVMILLFSV